MNFWIFSPYISQLRWCMIGCSTLKRINRHFIYYALSSWWVYCLSEGDVVGLEYKTKNVDEYFNAKNTWLIIWNLIATDWQSTGWCNHEGLKVGEDCWILELNDSNNEIISICKCCLRSSCPDRSVCLADWLTDCSSWLESGAEELDPEKILSDDNTHRTDHYTPRKAKQVVRKTVRLFNF